MEYLAVGTKGIVFTLPGDDGEEELCEINSLSVLHLTVTRPIDGEMPCSFKGSLGQVTAGGGLDLKMYFGTIPLNLLSAKVTGRLPTITAIRKIDSYNTYEIVINRAHVLLEPNLETDDEETE